MRKRRKWFYDPPVNYQQARGKAPPKHPPRKLQVSGDGWQVVALWEHIWGVWSCTQAPAPIGWMKGMNRDAAKLALLKMGANYGWL